MSTGKCNLCLLFAVEVEPDVRQVVDFLQEAMTMKKLNHPNVLSLIGVSIHNDKPCALLPLMNKGDLKKYLKFHQVGTNSLTNHIWIWSLGSNRNIQDRSKNAITLSFQNLQIDDLLSFCLGIAKGMEHLAEMKFVHRDLAARNCM